MVWHRTSGSLPWRQVTGTLFQTFSLAFDGLKETALIFLQGPPPRCHRCQERGHKFIECDRPHCRCCRRVGHEESEACKRRPSDVGIDSWHGSRSGPRWHGPTAWRRKRYTWDNSSCDDGDATAGACRLVWADANHRLPQRARQFNRRMRRWQMNQRWRRRICHDGIHGDDGRGNTAMLTRDIDIRLLSVCLSVRLSVTLVYCIEIA